MNCKLEGFWEGQTEVLDKTVKTSVELMSHSKGKFPKESQKYYFPIPQSITILLMKKHLSFFQEGVKSEHIIYSNH
jgi:hypothetical protein